MRALREQDFERFDLSNQRDLGRALTWVEQLGPEAYIREPRLLSAPARAFRIGVTGPPGAGKSTLIDGLIGLARRQGLRVAVLAVDPSSPFSQGAILGDRVRYQQHTTDEGVFIRSIGSRGSLGGLSASAWSMARVVDLAGWDVLVVETVGVGQSELEIMGIADHVTVVLVPEGGDGIQGLKAGLLEIADLFLVNKSDRPGAETFKLELERALLLGGETIPSILATAATSGQGLQAWWHEVDTIRQSPDWPVGRKTIERLRLEAGAQLNELWLRYSKAKLSGEVNSEADLVRALSQSISVLGTRTAP